jgi:hypothetical protein
MTTSPFVYLDDDILAPCMVIKNIRDIPWINQPVGDLYVTAEEARKPGRVRLQWSASVITGDEDSIEDLEKHPLLVDFLNWQELVRLLDNAQEAYNLFVLTPDETTPMYRAGKLRLMLAELFSNCELKCEPSETGLQVHFRPYFTNEYVASIEAEKTQIHYSGPDPVRSVTRL